LEVILEAVSMRNILTVIEVAYKLTLLKFLIQYVKERFDCLKTYVFRNDKRFILLKLASIFSVIKINFTTETLI